MKETRKGKIARLPKNIREQLNIRLEDGEPGNALVQWLNNLPEVKKVMAGQFGGRPVTEQNLSEWKAGGFQDWLQHDESRQIVSNLAEQHQELDEAAGGREISDRFAGMLSAQFVALTRKLLEEKSDPEKRWECFREVMGELSHLRRDDHRAARMTSNAQLKGRKLDLDERRLSLLKKKVAALEKANQPPKSRLSIEEQNQRLRDLLA